MKSRLLVIALALLVARPAAAANKEHQQLMADLRILQEQTQLLQNALSSLTDAVKAVNTRLDQQAEATRRTVADQKLQVDTLTNDLRVVREKVDDNNVRVGSLSQEVDALRQLVQQALARLTAPPPVADAGTATPGAPVAGSPAPAPPPTGAIASGASPTKVYEQAYADYASGLWDLAVDGFEGFLKDFPTSTQAPNAQFYIGRAYLNDAKYDKAVDAFDKVIRNYAMSMNVPDSYTLKGIALQSLKQNDRAREAWDFVIKTYPDSTAAGIARQRIQQLGPATR
ncbi:MAG TPA: tetratricopeptide repeat protein [Vicinamibacterales bacterium]|nr:tetratricopeptide repeat protein [Vicinamibacterales bacterium]